MCAVILQTAEEVDSQIRVAEPFPWWTSEIDGLGTCPKSVRRNPIAPFLEDAGRVGPIPGRQTERRDSITLAQKPKAPAVKDADMTKKGGVHPCGEANCLIPRSLRCRLLVNYTELRRG